MCSLNASLPFVANAQAEESEAWRSDLGEAMKLARTGNYEDSLPVLERLKKEHPADLDVTRDYITVLDWSGNDAPIPALYGALPDDQEPDYVLLAAGHAYRMLGQQDQASAIYRKGAALYPDDAHFTIGEIRTLLDSGKLMEAAQVSNDALVKSQKSQELNTVVEEARHVYAVSEAREGRYPEALQILASQHEAYPSDARITYDYIAVTSWSGNDKDALALYQTLPAGDRPDYVYAAIGKAYRNTNQPSDAAALYHEALLRYPSNRDFLTGEVNSLIDAGRTDEAATLAGSMSMHPDISAQEAVKRSQEEQALDALKAQQEQAADLARAGKYNEALAILTPLMKANPGNVSLKQDYLAELSWAGRDAEAARAYRAYGNGPLPGFVLAAVGHSYRNLKDFPAALATYKRGHAQSPADEALTAGVVGSLIDMKRTDEAQKIAEQDLKEHGNRLKILVLAADAADANGKIYESLIYAQRAVAINPSDPEALHAQIHAEQRMGAADAAGELAERSHAALTARDKSEIEGDKNASLVQFGKLEPVTVTERYKGSDQAIETLDQKIAVWSKQGNSKSPDLIRARFDRIVALRDRFRMQEAVNEYEDLRNQGVKVPAYVLGSVGDAYLYLRQPEAARDVYLEALKSTPDDFEIRRQLYFAYVECDDFHNAYATIDKLRDDQPVWYYLKGEPERQPNPNRAMAEIDTVNARIYGGELGEADDMLAPIADAAPYNVHNKEALGTLELTRGLPRTALQEFRLGTRAQDGQDVGTETGAAVAALDMRDYKSATEQIMALSKEYPEDLDVQRAMRQLDVYNMAELRVDSFYNMRSANNAAGGEGYGIDSDLYSAPINYNWRLFAGTGYSHEDEPNGEGAIGYEQSRAGVEYRDVHLLATAAPTYNVYHQSARAGFDTAADWTFNDMWTAGGGYQSFSNDEPLRAMNAGVTASRYNGNVEWRQNESREVRLDTYLMPFSDGNTRIDGAATYTERLYTTAYWRVDGIVDGGAEHNTADEFRNYYNPKLDFSALAGAKVTQTLYRRYETLYEHSLQITPGAYWQQGDGTRPAWTAIYQQNLQLHDTLELGASVNYTHQAYDGVQEDNVSFLVNLVERF